VSALVIFKNELEQDCEDFVPITKEKNSEMANQLQEKIGSQQNLLIHFRTIMAWL